MKNCKMKLKRIFTGILAVITVISTVELPSTVVYAGDNKQTGWSISDGTIEFGYENNKNTIIVNGKSQNYDSDGYIISGTTEQNEIKVTGGTHDITLDTANINVGGCAFSIESGAKVNLTLKGKNVLESKMSAGIQVPLGAELTIDGTGSLAAFGGYMAAGIGGGDSSTGKTDSACCGTITINGGEVYAETKMRAAGIGGGRSGDGGLVTINGGTVTAIGGTWAAGIGGGLQGNGKKTIINGGNVTAVAGGLASGIGGGRFAGGGDVIINGGNVSAQGGEYSSGIGTGYEAGGNYGEVIINGGIVEADGGTQRAGIGEVESLEISAGTVITSGEKGGINSRYIVITGGNVKAESVNCLQLKNGADADSKEVSLVKLTLLGTVGEEKIVVEGLSENFLKDAKLIDGELWLWLPTEYDCSEITYVKVGDTVFKGAVDNSNEGIFRSDAIETVNNPVLSRTSNLSLFSVGDNRYYAMGERSCKYTGKLTIQDTSASRYVITVDSGVHDIVAEDIYIDIKDREKAAFSIKSGASVNLTLKGVNTFKSGAYCAGIQVAKGASITIDGTGKLEAYGGSEAVGIGDKPEKGFGAINIKGGTILAQGDYDMVGIGCTGVVVMSPTEDVSIDDNSESEIVIDEAEDFVSEDNSVVPDGSVIITGGNVYAKNGIDITPKNGSGSDAQKVYCFTVTLRGLKDTATVTSVKGIDNYNVAGIETLETNKLYLYLPKDLGNVSNIAIIANNMEFSTAYTDDAFDKESREAILRTNHRHTWKYNVNENTITAICMTEDNTSLCDYADQIGGRVTLQGPKDCMYTGTEKKADVILSNPEFKEREVVYKDETGKVLPSAPKEPGKYTVSVTAGDATVSESFEIKYLETEEVPTIRCSTEKAGWYTDDVYVCPPSGYYIDSLPSLGSLNQLMIYEDMDTDYTYCLKEKETGYTTEPKTIHIKRDANGPEVEMVVGQNKYKGSWKVITYELAYKDAVDISITAADKYSGVASIQYQIVKKGNKFNANANWISGDKLTVRDTGAFVVYAKVTDNAGNETIINSNGLIVYKDSIFEQDSIIYTYGTEQDLKIGVTLNENTLNKIMLGETELVKNKEYTLEEGSISFKRSYLEKLSVGTYKLSLDLNPAGDTDTKFALTNVLELKVQNKPILLNEESINVIAPIAGAIPQKNIVKASGYTGNISWNCAGKTFGFNTAYTASVTLIPNPRHEFCENMKIPGYTIVYNEDSSITLSKQFEPTRKAVVTSLTTPKIRKFDAYNETLDEALKYLNSKANTVEVTAEDGEAQLPVKWSFEGNYTAQTNGVNTFKWKLDADNYVWNASLITEGTVQIENMDIVEVDITSKDTEIIYDGESYDVSQLFKISEHTGAEHYTITEITGDGVLNGTELVIEKAGTFEITVNIEAAAPYDAAASTATLTVGKANGEASVELENWVYGDTPKAWVISSKDYDMTKAAVTYTSVDGKEYSSAEIPVNAGEYRIVATLPENNLYKEIRVEAPFVIERKDIEGAVITLGKKLVYNGSRQVQTVAGVSVDGMVLLEEDYIVTGNIAADTETDYTLTIIGQGNFIGSETIDYTVDKVEAPVIADISKNYLYTVGSDKQIVTIDVAGLLPADRGTTTYILTDSPMEYIVDSFVDEDGKLSYEVDAAKSVDSTVLTVTAATTKYQDINIRININLVNTYISEDMPGIPRQGEVIKDSGNTAVYKVTKSGLKGGTVEYIQPLKKSVNKVMIPATIKVNSITFKVTGIAKNAFKNNKKLKQVTIGQNVKYVGANAFNDCKKLKNMTIKTTRLTKKNVGANAFKGMKEGVIIKVPKKKYKMYESLLKARGSSSEIEIKKL